MEENNQEEEKKCVRAIFEGLNSKEGKIFRVFNKSCTGRKRSVLWHLLLCLLQKYELQLEDRWHKSSSFFFWLWDHVLSPLMKVFSTEQSHFLYFFLIPLAQWTCHTVPEKFEFEGTCKTTLFHLLAMGGGDQVAQCPFQAVIKTKQATQTHKVLWAFQHCPPQPQHMSRSSASPKTVTCSWALQGDTSSNLKAGWCLCVLSWVGTRTFPDHRMLPVLLSGWDKGRQHMCFAGQRRWEFSRVKHFLCFMLN